jgi:uncharacterized small protein (DUF1192 family)
MKKYFFCYVLLLFVIGCSAKSGLATMEAAEASVADYYYSSGQAEAELRRDDAGIWQGRGFNPEGPAGIDGQTPPASRGINSILQENDVQRKLVKRASLNIRVEDLAAADAAIGALLQQYGAYTASTQISENSRSYVVRVPASGYDDFLAGMSGMGRILNRNESAEDVTLRYYDLEGRLATKQELLKTFQAYLGKAKNIEEILSVEERIAGLQSEIDRTGNELRQLGNLVDYATISIDIYGPVAAAVSSGTTLAERIWELLSGFGGFLSTVAVALLGIVIYGVPLLLLAALLFWLLLGRVGLLKKLWRAALGKSRRTKETGNGGKTSP